MLHAAMLHKAMEPKLWADFVHLHYLHYPFVIFCPFVAQWFSLRKPNLNGRPVL